MIKVFLKKILDFFFKIYYFLISFIYILLPNNFLKIFRSNTIILMDDGGFGHQFLVPDLIRYTFESKKKILLITLFDQTRYNKYLTACFNVPYIEFKTCSGKFIYKIAKKKFGEYENSEFKLINKSLRFFLNGIMKKKIINRLELYNYHLNIFKKENPDIDLTNFNFKGFKDYELPYYYKIEYKKKINQTYHSI